MKCHIPGPNVKVFGRTVHAFSRLGCELYLEAVPDGVLLRTLNATESAYSIITFNKSFFSYFKYDYYSTDEDADGLKCRISMKSALNAFKSPMHMDKQVENLEIKLEPESCKLIFQFKYKHGVVKTHFVSILDCREMKNVDTEDTVPNAIFTQQRVLSEALNNFHNSNELITIEATARCLFLRNYVDTATDFGKLIRTQICLQPNEFESYSIGTETVLTFGLKEFKALLSFTEALNLPIQIHFQTTGLPAVFIVQNNVTFEARFILATSKSDETQSTTTQSTSCTERVKRKNSTTNNKSTNKRSHLEEDNVSKCLEEDSHLFNFIEIPGDVDINKSGKNMLNTNDDQTLNNNCDIDSIDFDDGANEMLMECDNIPPSPTAKIKLKSVFSKCFESTFDPGSIQGVVLEENSDSE